MGSEICHEARWDHPELGGLSWSVWEYPQAIENCRETQVNGHETLKDFDRGLEHAKPDRLE
jgi:hypothetical protein